MSNRPVSPPEPLTASGRRLLTDLALVVGAETDGHGQQFAERILAAAERGVLDIEAEAVTADRALLAEQVRAHVATHRGLIRCAWNCDDFLRLIEGTPVEEETPNV